MQRLPIVFALLFGLFLLAITFIADRGDGGRWWGFVDQIPYGDKAAHLVLMGMLAFLCNLGFPPRRDDGYRRIITTTSLVLLALLTADEIAQAFKPHRTCDPMDWLADLLGLTLGQMAALRTMRRLPNRSRGAG
jgi:polysaccharide biosynthesis protein VpsQ